MQGIYTTQPDVGRGAHLRLQHRAQHYDVTGAAAEPLRGQLQRRAARPTSSWRRSTRSRPSASATATARTPTSPSARPSSPSATRPRWSLASTTTRPTSTTAPIPRTATTGSSPPPVVLPVHGLLGRHDLKGGFEYYRSRFTGGNSQSPTNFVFYADYKTDDAGDPVLDANGNLTPVFIPGGGLILNWLAERGRRPERQHDVALPERPLDAQQPLGLQPRPALRAGAQRHHLGEHPGIDTTTLVPRLGVDFDPTGSGRFKLQGDVFALRRQLQPEPVRQQPGRRQPEPRLRASTSVRRARASTSRPASIPQNYELLNAQLPTGNVSFDDGLSSPLVKEWTRLRGHADRQRPASPRPRTRTARSATSWRTSRRSTSGRSRSRRRRTCLGCEGPFLLDRTVYRNSDLPRRDYQALQLSAGYRVGNRWNLSANYTLPDPQPRQLRGREHEPAGDLVRPRRLPRDPGARAQLPRRPAQRLPEAQGARLDHLRPRPGPHRQPQPGPALALRLRPDLQPRRAEPGAVRRPAGAGSGLCAAAGPDR